MTGRRPRGRAVRTMAGHGGPLPEQAAHYLPSHLAARLADPAARPAVEAHLASLLHTVTTYLPRSLLRRLLARPVPGRVWGEAIVGTLLFADLSGFTSLSAALSQQGVAGAEQLVAIVNAIFTTLLAIIEEEEGDLIVFGGDALLVLFAEEGHPLAAVRAARRMQQSMAAFSQLETEAGSFPMAIHIGVNSGQFLAASVGRPQAMQYVLLGRTVERTAQAEAMAGPGEIVVGVATARELPVSSSRQLLQRPWVRLPADLPLPPAGAPGAPLVLPEGPGVVAALDAVVPYLPAGLLERLIPYPGEATVEADLKPVAVLFANLLGFEPLLDLFGPERLDDAVAWLQRYMLAMQEVVERCGGTVNKTDLSQQGGKLLVLFGAPSKHEDDPERAVHAALGMQRAVEALAPVLAAASLPPLGQRIALHTGDVFAGNVGSSWRKEYTVMGTTVNLAAHLMAAAEPGQIWASGALYNRFGPTCRAEGPFPVDVKGWDEPQPAYHILDFAVSRRPSRVRLLVGREEERTLLLRALGEARRGQGQLTSLVGEAGMGKSRLAEEAAQVAQEQGMRVLLGHTPSYGERIPYAPCDEVLRACLGWTADMPAEKRAALLQGRLAAVSPDQGAWAPVVAEALGLGMPETAETTDLSPRLRRQRFFDLTLQLLQDEAARQPLLVILEDLHWIGPLAGELLTYLGRNVAHTAVMMLGTCRAVEATLPWADFSHHRAIELEPLSAAASQELVAALAGCDTLDPALAALIWERAQGNPLFVEEIVEALEERGVLVRDDGVLHLRGDPEQARREIPPNIQEVVLSRIDHLGEEVRSVLRVAAVIDQKFLFPVLVGVFPYADPEPVLRERVEALCQAGMLEPAGGDSYAFRHTLLREVAYQSILHARRRELHGRVGRYCEAYFGGQLEQHYGFLAHHYRYSADPAKAVEYALKAGRQAARSYANEAAGSYFQQALEVAEQAPGVLPLAEAVGVRQESGDVLRQAGRFDEALARYQQALQEGQAILGGREVAELYRLCSYVHERSGRYEEGLDSLQQAHQVLLRYPEGPASLEMARLLAAISTFHWRRGSYEEANLAGHEALAIAQKAARGPERSGLLGDIYVQLGNVATMTGRYPEARRYFEKALQFRQQAGQRPEIAIAHNNLGYLWHLQDEYERAIASHLRCLEAAQRVGDPYIVAYAANNLGSAWYELGDYYLAAEYCQQSLAARERIGDQAGVAACWDTMGLIHSARGEYAQALELHRRSLALKRSLGSRYEEANSLANLALTQQAQGNPAEALALSREALALLEEVGDQTLLAEARIVAAEACLALGEVAEARRQAEAALATAGAVGRRKDGAVAARVLAEVLAADPSADPAEVERLFRQSVEALSAIHCRLEWAHACRSYGQFLRARGEEEKALDWLEQAGRLFDKIGVSPGAVRA